MPNAKLLQSIGGDTSVTVYAVVKCVAGVDIGKYLNDADGTFVTPAPADPYVALTEDGTIKGLFSLSESRAAWTDGVYRAISYTQAGGSPAPATDTSRSIQELVIQTDTEISLQDVDTEVDALRADYTTARAGKLDNLDATISSRATLVASDVWAVGTRALTDKVGFELSTAGVDAILDDVVEGTLTLRQVVRIMLAGLAGKSSGGGTATILFMGADGTTTRITATVDATGNRTAITVNGA